MNIISIDLSTRSTGLCYFENDTLKDFTIVSSKDLKNEELILYNVKNIIDWMYGKDPESIIIEGLSFSAISSSKDFLAGQFWSLRTFIKHFYPDLPIIIIPVTEWRSPVLSKDEKKSLNLAKKEFKANKKPLNNLKGDERKEVIAFNKNLELNASVKEQTWNKLSSEVQCKFLDFIDTKNHTSNSKYDLCDAYFLGDYILNRT